VVENGNRIIPTWKYLLFSLGVGPEAKSLPTDMRKIRHPGSCNREAWATSDTVFLFQLEVSDEETVSESAP
jgi:hypothetical protein